MAKPIAITDKTFEEQVLKAEGVVMVDFWAPWCPPCRAIAPILEELAGEYAGQITIAKVNTDEDSQYAMKYQVQGIPTLIFFRDGKEIDRIVGAGPKDFYRSKINELTGAAETV